MKFCKGKDLEKRKLDIPVEECRLVLHQPKLREIALIGEKDFLNGV